MKRKTVLVTGARGTVGNYVVSLAEAAGHRVVASDISARGIRSPVRGEIRPMDLRDPSSLDTLVEGCDAVIHTAAVLDVRENAATLSAINSEAVADLHEAATRAGCSRFVHLSVATLYAPSADPCTEDSRLAPEGPYSMSKLGGELYFRGNAGKSGCPWTVLRSAPIYGRRGRHFGAALLAVGPLLRLLSPRLPRPAGGPQGSMVHAEDVARAALFVLENDSCAGQVFNVADNDPMALGQRLTTTFHAYGLKTWPVPAPPGAVLDGLLDALSGTLSAGLDVTTLAGWRTVIARHDLKPALRPRFDAEILADLRRSRVVQTRKLRSLGWAPRFPHFDVGFKEVLRWYQAERWVPRY